jgi:hypothetical protein
MGGGASILAIFDLYVTARLGTRTIANQLS